ncbi:hypothetical protein SprV_0100428400 [Sparganum proliferum]
MLFRKICGVFVRSSLDYAVQAWRRWLKKGYRQLERVKSRVAKMGKNLCHLPYETRLAELNLLPLNYGQLRGDLIQTCRIVRGPEPGSPNKANWRRWVTATSSSGAATQRQRDATLESPLPPETTSQDDCPVSRRASTTASQACASLFGEPNPLPLSVSGHPLPITSFNEVTTEFYEDLHVPLATVSRADNLVVLDDFNARVGTGHAARKGVRGLHGIGGCNNNLCRTPPPPHQHLLATWMHQRLRSWQLLDYVLVRNRNRQDVLVTKVICDTDGWTDHRLTVSKMRLHLQPLRRPQGK